MISVAHPPAPPLSAPALSLPVARVVCVLVVASAIKMPLGIPLYLNALLLLLGLFTVCVVQALDRLFLWMLALIALGVVSAGQGEAPVESAARLLQLLALIFVADLVARLDPAMLARYLVLLLLLMVLVGSAEVLLPTPLYDERALFGASIPRQAGLDEDHDRRTCRQIRQPGEVGPVNKMPITQNYF